MISLGNNKRQKNWNASKLCGWDIELYHLYERGMKSPFFTLTLYSYSEEWPWPTVSARKLSIRTPIIPPLFLFWSTWPSPCEREVRGERMLCDPLSPKKRVNALSEKRIVFGHQYCLKIFLTSVASKIRKSKNTKPLSFHI